MQIFGIPLKIDFLDLDWKQYQYHCNQLSRTESGKVISNIGGYHSSTDIHTKEEFSELFYYIDFLIQEIDPQFKIKQSWLNINGKGDYNLVHEHTDADYSGVVYIKVPPQSGNLIFHNPMLTKYLMNHRVHQLEPKDGMVILFPNWLPHEVSPNDSDEERISIAFNILKSGEL